MQGKEPAELITQCLQERRAALLELKMPWRQWADELLALCHQGVASKSVDGRKMQPRYFEPWFEKIKAWAEDESLEQLDIGTGFTRLTPDGMAEAWKGRGTRPSGPGCHARPEGQPRWLADARCRRAATCRPMGRSAFEDEKRAAPRWASTKCCCASMRPCKSDGGDAWRL